jgi:hypothetical protein
LIINDQAGNIVQTIMGSDVTGVDAQGNINPRSNFDDHVLYEIENKYYDPSYGTGPFSDKSAWVTSSLSGYGSLLVYFSASNIAFPILWLHEKTQSSNSNTIKFKIK